MQMKTSFFVRESGNKMRKTISLLNKGFLKGLYLLIATSTIFACSQNKPDPQSTFKKEHTQK